MRKPAQAKKYSDASTPQTGRESAPPLDSAGLCYEALALLAGVRGILLEMDTLAVPDADSYTHADRLLDEAIDRIKRVADAEVAHG